MKFSVSYLLIALLLGACSNAPVPTANQSTIAIQPIVNQAEDAATETRFSQNLNELIAQVSQTQQIPLASLEAGFLDAKTIPSIRKLVLPPSATFKKNWLVYRQRFIEPVRLKAGRAFWEQNRAFLSQTEQTTGVPAELIVAIIANNNSQGINQSRLNACLNQNSSYAGAIGLPQFMPSSIRSFALDGDGDGRIDLRQSPKDAIASVGNFMKMHGWQTGMPIYFPVQEKAIQEAKVLADDEPQLKYTVQELIDKGILISSQGDLQAGGVPPQSKALIVDLPYPDKDGNDQVYYVVGLNNFLTIVQYNRSYFYAQSVAEFAQELGYKNQSVVPVLSSAKDLNSVSAKSKPKNTKVKKKAKHH